MPALRPVKKIEEFYEKLKKIRSKSELKEFLKKIETFAKLYPSDESYRLAAYTYLIIGDTEKAIEWIEKTETPDGKLYELEIKVALGLYTDAYKLASRLEEKITDEEIKAFVIFNKLVILTFTYNFEEAKKLVDENLEKIERYIKKTGQSMILEQIKQKINEYMQAKTMIETNEELQKIHREIENIIKRNIEMYKITPINYVYIDGGDTEIVFLIIIPDSISREILRITEDEILEKTIMKYPDIEFSFSFVKAKKEEIEIGISASRL